MVSILYTSFRMIVYEDSTLISHNLQSNSELVLMSVRSHFSFDVSQVCFLFSKGQQDGGDLESLEDAHAARGEGKGQQRLLPHLKKWKDVKNTGVFVAHS
jgi:hypothetical protein